MFFKVIQNHNQKFQSGIGKFLIDLTTFIYSEYLIFILNFSCLKYFVLNQYLICLRN